VTIDFLAFPGLRDALIQEKSLYMEASVETLDAFEKDFLSNLTVQWPRLKPVLIRTSPEECADGGPRFKLDPSFASHCLVYENWAMRDFWTRKYPHLAQYVNKCRPSFSL
jgi:hypothetical protein